MYSTRRVYDNIYEVTNGWLKLQYHKNSEYVNATRFVRSIRPVGSTLKSWLENRTVQTLMQLLGEQTEAEAVGPHVPEPICYQANGDTWIHPSLAISLATWCGCRYNYPMSKLLQHIIVTNSAPPTPPPTHTFTFFEHHDPRYGPLKKYRAMECPRGFLVSELDKVMRKHPQAEIIFQQLEVPEAVRMVHTIREEYNGIGSNICVDRDMYCGSMLEEAELLVLLQNMTCCNIAPNISRRHVYDALV